MFNLNQRNISKWRLYELMEKWSPVGEKLKQKMLYKVYHHLLFILSSHRNMISKSYKHHMKHPMVLFLHHSRKKMVTWKFEKLLFYNMLTLAVVVVLFFPGEMFVLLLF